MKNVIALVCFIASSLFASIGMAQAPEGGSTIDPPAASAPAGNPCGTDAGCNAALASCRADLATATTSSDNLVAALAACTGKAKQAVPPPKPRPLPPPPTCGILDDGHDSVAVWTRGHWECVATDRAYIYIAKLRSDLAALNGRVPDLSQYNLYLQLVGNLTRLVGQPGQQFAANYADLFTWVEDAELRLKKIDAIDRWINDTLVPWMLMHDQAVGALCPAVESCQTNDLACRCEYAAKHGQGSKVDVSLGARGLLMHRPSAGAAGGGEVYAEGEIRIPGTSTSVIGDVSVGLIGDADTGTQSTTSETVAIRQYLGSEERTSIDIGPSFRQYFSTHSAGYQGVLQDKGMGMEIDGRLQLRHCFTAAACLGLGGYLGGSPSTNYFTEPGQIDKDNGVTGGGLFSISGVITNF